MSHSGERLLILPSLLLPYFIQWLCWHARFISAISAFLLCFKDIQCTWVKGIMFVVLNSEQFVFSETLSQLQLPSFQQFSPERYQWRNTPVSNESCDCMGTDGPRGRGLPANALCINHIHWDTVWKEIVVYIFGPVLWLPQTACHSLPLCCCKSRNLS